MKQFPQGIFQSIEWLIKQVDKLKKILGKIQESIYSPDEMEELTVQQLNNNFKKISKL